MSTSRSLGVGMLTLFLATAARGQHLLYTLQGDVSGDEFGSSLRSAGDVDGDGVPDIVVGAPNAGAGAGLVRVFSGKDGGLLLDLKGAAVGDRLGSAVDGAGDVDGDGLCDLIAAAPGVAPAGAVFVFSGADGQILHSLFGAVGEDFGSTVGAAGDVDGDLAADVMVGAPAITSGGIGFVRVFSGADGSEIRTLSASFPAEEFGVALDLADDMDADGVGELVVGVGAAFDAGLQEVGGGVRVYSGKSGALLHSIYLGPHDGDCAFGEAVAAGGDVDGDGVGDFAVGDSWEGALGTSCRAFVYSGATGALLFDVKGNGRFGSSLAMLRAANADGRSDLLVGAPGNGAGDLGEAVFFSGSSEQALYAYFPPSHHGGFGSKVCSVGDVDLDGLTDVAIADSTTETVEVRRSSDVYLCASPKYLSVPGTFMLGLGESKPGNVFFLFLSSVDGVPIFCPCTSIFGRFPSSGEFRRDVFVTADLAGHSVGFLAFTFNRFGKAQLYGEEHVIFE